MQYRFSWLFNLKWKNDDTVISVLWTGQAGARYPGPARAGRSVHTSRASGPAARVLGFDVLLLHCLYWQSKWLGSGLILVPVLKTEICFSLFSKNWGCYFCFRDRLCK